MKTDWLQKIFLCAVLTAAILACRSSNLTPEPIPPTQFTPPESPAPTQAALPTSEPTLKPPPAVSPDEIQAAQATSDTAGVARFQDPISGFELAVEFRDEATFEPVAGLEIMFATNGPRVLVVASDPERVFAPVFQELVYDELAALPQGGKLASPRKLELATVLLVVKLIDLYQDFGEYQAFLSNLPAVDEWSLERLSFCVNPEQAEEGLSFLGKRVLDLLLMKFPADTKVLRAAELIFGELGSEGIDGIFEGYSQTEPPSIMRFTVYSFAGGILPDMLYVDGFCLPPLDRSQGQSALDWLNYGLAQQDPYAFDALLKQDGLYYARYIEGGQEKTRQEFLAELEVRLPSGGRCVGYRMEYGYIQVWTAGWSPAWEMTESCYVGCSAISPPHRSPEMGFFLSLVNGEWWLKVGYVNPPEKYYFVGDFALAACNTPLSQIGGTVSPLATPTPGLACPGAPPQRMTVDERGYVCTRSDRIIVRDGPGRGSNEVTRLSPGTLFRVTGGPSCANNWSWWKIRTDDGVIGWVAEGGDQVDPYFICPAP
jgi:hypothetical protein